MKCEMIVGYKDRDGAPGDEVYCQNEAVGTLPKVNDAMVCQQCADSMISYDPEFGPLLLFILTTT